jgi:hypothetical protein
VAVSLISAARPSPPSVAQMTPGHSPSVSTFLECYGAHPIPARCTPSPDVRTELTNLRSAKLIADSSFRLEYPTLFAYCWVVQPPLGTCADLVLLQTTSESICDQQLGGSEALPPRSHLLPVKSDRL